MDNAILYGQQRYQTDGCYSSEKGFSKLKNDFPYRQQVDINENKGYFQGWKDSGEVDKNGDTITGGLLNWTQNSIYVEISSSRLTIDIKVNNLNHKVI